MSPGISFLLKRSLRLHRSTELFLRRNKMTDHTKEGTKDEHLPKAENKEVCAYN